MVPIISFLCFIRNFPHAGSHHANFIEFFLGSLLALCKSLLQLLVLGEQRLPVLLPFLRKVLQACDGVCCHTLECLDVVFCIGKQLQRLLLHTQLVVECHAPFAFGYDVGFELVEERCLRLDFGVQVVHGLVQAGDFLVQPHDLHLALCREVHHSPLLAGRIALLLAGRIDLLLAGRIALQCVQQRLGILPWLGEQQCALETAGLHQAHWCVLARRLRRRCKGRLRQGLAQATRHLPHDLGLLATLVVEGVEP
mmetsp:Transcript_36535/g.91599  ORF Transcript_36535/g.91599 Transcript_36535/m.91599 type:complete len:253 (+) Transcript_36535:774-1532(+)